VSCILCGSPADGRLRVAVWEEEEKGRLGAHAVVLCADCHRKFLAGEITRAEIARAYHKAKGYEPRGWIGRIDRDFLLDIACLECGVLLPVTGQPGELRCPSCGTTNRFARRGDHWLTAEALV
jgi:DNA-directed RNA polymerase subunit RPC12/RpoP